MALRYAAAAGRWAADAGRRHHPRGRPWPPIWVFLSARAGYRSSLYPNRRYVSRANGRGLKSSRRARARDRKPPTVPGGRRTGNVYWLPPGAKITKNGSDPGEAPQWGGRPCSSLSYPTAQGRGSLLGVCSRGGGCVDGGLVNSSLNGYAKIQLGTSLQIIRQLSKHILSRVSR